MNSRGQAPDKNVREPMTRRRETAARTAAMSQRRPLMYCRRAVGVAGLILAGCGFVVPATENPVHHNSRLVGFFLNMRMPTG